MIFIDTEIESLVIIEIEKKKDFRGFFARSWCEQEMESHGLNPNILQANISFNTKKGTFRGMHFQKHPYEEAKLIRCSRGAILDIAVDLRKESSTYKKWVGVELSAENYKMLYVPEHFAHGFVTLKNNTEVNYLVSQFYHPGAEAGFRWNDPQFKIKLPVNVAVIAERDNNYPDYDDTLFS